MLLHSVVRNLLERDLEEDSESVGVCVCGGERREGNGGVAGDSGGAGIEKSQEGGRNGSHGQVCDARRERS